MRLDVRIYKKHDADIAALSYAGYSVTNMIKDALDALVENRPFAIDIGHVDVPDFADHRNVHVTITLKTHANPKLVELIKSIRPGYRCAFCKMVLRNTFIRQDYNAYLPAKYGPLFENQGFVSEDYMKYVHPLEEYKTDGPTGEEPPKDERGKRAETFLQSQGRVNKDKGIKSVYGAQNEFSEVSGDNDYADGQNSRADNGSGQTERDTDFSGSRGEDVNGNTGYDGGRDDVDTGVYRNDVYTKDYTKDNTTGDGDIGGRTDEDNRAGENTAYIRRNNSEVVSASGNTSAGNTRMPATNARNRANGGVPARKPANMAGQTVARPHPVSVSNPGAKVISGHDISDNRQMVKSGNGTNYGNNIIINGVELTPEQFALIQQMAAQSANTKAVNAESDTSDISDSYDEATPDSIDESAAPAEEPKLAGDSSLMDMFNNI